MKNLVKNATRHLVIKAYETFTKDKKSISVISLPGSVWEFENAGKTSRFTPKSAEKIYDLLMESSWKNLSIKSLAADDDFLNWISPLILKIGKGVDSTENRAKVKNNFLRNLKLMWLDNMVIPEKVSFACKIETSRGIKLEKKSVTLDRIKILEGTEWIATTPQPKGFDPFENFLK